MYGLIAARFSKDSYHTWQSLQHPCCCSCRAWTIELPIVHQCSINRGAKSHTFNVTLHRVPLMAAFSMLIESWSTNCRRKANRLDYSNIELVINFSGHLSWSDSGTRILHIATGQNVCHRFMLHILSILLCETLDFNISTLCNETIKVFIPAYVNMIGSMWHFWSCNKTVGMILR